MAKLSVRLNFAYCGQSASHSRQYGRFFFIITSTKMLGPSTQWKRRALHKTNMIKSKSLLSYIYRRAEIQYKQRGRLSSVNRVTRLRPVLPGNPGSFWGSGRILSVLHSTQAAPGPAQHHILLLPSNPPPAVKHPIKEATHRVYECVELNLHLVIRLLGMVLMYRCSN